MFKTRISMKCTKEQYTIHLQEELEKRGYAPSKDSFNFWTCPENEYITNYYERDGELGNLPYQDIRSESRQYIGEFNAPLFLAIASRTGTGSIGEWITPNSKSELMNFTKGKEYQVIELFDEGSVVFDDSSHYHRLTRDFLELHFRTLTVKELKKKFAPEKENNKSTSLKAGSYITVEKDESKNQFICILKEDLGEHDDELSVLVRIQKDGGIILDYREDVEGITIRKSTLEEIALLDEKLSEANLRFNREELTVEGMIEIPKKSLREIHDVACSTWKDRIMEWLRESNQFEDTIVLSESRIRDMFRAANADQKKVLTRVFNPYREILQKNAIVAGLDEEKTKEMMTEISKLLFGDGDFLQIGYNYPEMIGRPDLRMRSLCIPEDIAITLHEGPSGSTILEFIRKV